MSENFANIINEWPLFWKLAWPYRVENNDLQAEEKWERWIGTEEKGRAWLATEQTRLNLIKEGFLFTLAFVVQKPSEKTHCKGRSHSCSCRGQGLFSLRPSSSICHRLTHSESRSVDLQSLSLSAQRMRALFSNSIAKVDYWEHLWFKILNYWNTKINRHWLAVGQRSGALEPRERCPVDFGHS